MDNVLHRLSSYAAIVGTILAAFSSVASQVPQGLSTVQTVAFIVSGLLGAGGVLAGKSPIGQ